MTDVDAGNDPNGSNRTDSPSPDAEVLDLDAGSPPAHLKKLSAGEKVSFNDHARRNIAFILLSLLAAIIITSFFLLLWALADATDEVRASENFEVVNGWLNIVFGPVVTLVGSAVGFYFGAQTAKNAASEPGDEA